MIVNIDISRKSRFKLNIAFSKQAVPANSWSTAITSALSIRLITIRLIDLSVSRGDFLNITATEGWRCSKRRETMCYRIFPCAAITHFLASITRDPRNVTLLYMRVVRSHKAVRHASRGSLLFQDVININMEKLLTKGSRVYIIWCI